MLRAIAIDAVALGRPGGVTAPHRAKAGQERGEKAMGNGVRVTYACDGRPTGIRWEAFKKHCAMMEKADAVLKAVRAVAAPDSPECAAAVAEWEAALQEACRVERAMLAGEGA